MRCLPLCDWTLGVELWCPLLRLTDWQLGHEPAGGAFEARHFWLGPVHFCLERTG